KKIGHNLKIDIIQLFRLGIDINNYTFDSMIAQYLINPSQSDYSINNISEEYLDYYGIDRDELLGKGKSAKSFNDLDEEQIISHISFLLETVVELEHIMLNNIQEQSMENLYNDIELPLVEVLANME